MRKKRATFPKHSTSLSQQKTSQRILTAISRPAYKDGALNQRALSLNPTRRNPSQIQNRKSICESPYPPTAIGVKFGVCLRLFAVGERDGCVLIENHSKRLRYRFVDDAGAR